MLKRTQSGFTHYLIMILIVIGVGVGGTYVLVKGHAQTPSAVGTLSCDYNATNTTITFSYSGAVNGAILYRDNVKLAQFPQDYRNVSRIDGGSVNPGQIYTYKLQGGGKILATTSCSTLLCPADYSQAPDLKNAAIQVQQECQKIFPKIEAYLAPALSPAPYKITFDTNQYAAYVLSNQLHISIAYARSAKPNDLAATLAHEMTHLDQGYAPGGPKWATEGIADFMRHKLGYTWDYFNCAPTEDWTSGYGCTASMLTYASRVYNAPQLVHDIHVADIAGTYSDDIFVKDTGKLPMQLYTECLQYECKGGKPLGQ